MAFLGLLIVWETVMQALRVPLGSVSVSSVLAGGTSMGLAGRLKRLCLLGFLDHHRFPQPLIRLRAGCNGLIALLLGLLAADALDRHFLLHHLHSQFGNLLLAIHTLDRLILASGPWTNLVWRF
jgi:hypothetical protein